MAEIITGGGEVENFLSVEAVSRDAHRRIGSIAARRFGVAIVRFCVSGVHPERGFLPFNSRSG